MTKLECQIAVLTFFENQIHHRATEIAEKMIMVIALFRLFSGPLAL
jgi:hypothetical protein